MNFINTHYQIMDSLKSCFVIISTCLFSLSYPSLLQGSPKSNETDRVALVEFRNKISDDPDQIFSSWSDTVDFCNWPGITCGHRHQRVTKLELPGSKISGSLSPYIGNLSFLRIINIENNSFTGEIPPEICNLRRLTALLLDNNSLSGQLPENISSCTNLREIRLLNNKLVGEIPRGLAALSELGTFAISNNKFTGKFPDFFGNLSSLEAIDGMNNNFEGTIPTSLGRLQKLKWIDSQKQFQFPNTLSRCISLEYLDMGNNLFEGNIYTFLSPLKGLQYLDLSRNNFSGDIPNFLEKLQLTYLNLSFNRFVGEVPNQGVFSNVIEISIMGNEKLCGGISQLNLPNCPTTKLKRRGKISVKVIIAAATGISILFVVLLLLATYIGMKTIRRRFVKLHSGLVPVVPFLQITYEDIFRATEGFNPNNLIGTGSFGSVYKGIHRNGDNRVAIKILNLRIRAASKSFMTECEALRNIRHRNLVKIFTACSTVDFQGNDFKALVYEYMENGSLEEWLHPKHATEGVYRNISLIHRMSIAIDIACAVEYLHHECETPVIHCDLKPSNILLDAEMNAHVNDFGLARILYVADVVLQVSSVGLRGTVGYSPPEYGIGSEASREGDVYSYGILLLEMFTGKRPTADMFEGAWNIRCYCEAALPERAAEIADPCLFSNEFAEGSSVRAPRRVKECLAKVLEIGIRCCQESPRERMDIREVAAKLRSIKPLAS